MRIEAINPGYSNPIFEYSVKKPDISRVEFLNSEIESGEIIFQFDDLLFMDEFIKLDVNVSYVVKAKGRNDVITPLKNKYSYKIVNKNSISGKELFVILENCIDRLNIVLQSEIPPLSYLSDLLPKPLWEDNKDELERLSRKMKGS